MQTDAQPWIFLRQLNRLVEAEFVHHQAGAGQNAFAMRADDGFIDGMRTAKIVRVDDETPGGIRACHSPVWRLPWPNGTTNAESKSVFGPNEAGRGVGQRR